jgi:osmotically inducible protein OsmC
MPVRRSEAVWNGGLKDGRGTMKLGSRAFEGSYSFSSRFEQGKGTNPEELIGAAHAGCFSMQLAGLLEASGHPATRIETAASVHIERDGGGFTITAIELDTTAAVPGLDAPAFREVAGKAKLTCPVSRALAGVPITLNAQLEG